MLKEFREFALKGNMVDLAIGVIIGAAFGGLVQSIVNDLLMPIIGLVTGGIDFSQMYVQLSGAPQPTLDAGPRDRRHPRLRQLHHARHQLPDRRLGAVHGGQGDEPAEAPAAAGAGDAAAADARGSAARRNPRPAGQESSRSIGALIDRATQVDRSAARRRAILGVRADTLARRDEPTVPSRNSDRRASRRGARRAGKRHRRGLQLRPRPPGPDPALGRRGRPADARLHLRRRGRSRSRAGETFYT